ncbi:fic family toxin-antitoxin system, toxin component [Streptomyces sp. NPDC098101]|uniref:fic family toxin-antitoxin system, toxin component n=1 Tax=Streptomyces sp. NPDC098101 TaxID=3366096 RepID=UPI0038239D0A
MALHIDLSWILEVTERAGRADPAPDDLGVPLAAVARHRAELFDQPVYDGPYARAAALVHTLGRCRWLERSNLTVACAVAVMYLNAGGIPADPTRAQLTALAHELYDPRTTTARIAELLRTWSTGDRAQEE